MAAFAQSATEASACVANQASGQVRTSDKSERAVRLTTDRRDARTSGLGRRRGVPEKSRLNTRQTDDAVTDRAFQQRVLHRRSRRG